MSATISSLVSGATPPPTATADTRDSSATQPLAPAQLSPFPSPSTSMTDNSAASIHVPSTSDPSSFDPIPRARANSFPTSKRERSAAEARQAAAEASGKSGWKKRWRKIRNLFKAMRGAFRSSSKSDVGSVMEKDERGLLMVPKRKHKAMIITEELPPPMPPVPPLPPQVNVDRIGVRSAPNHHISKPSPSHATAVDDTDDDSTPLALLSSPNLAPPRIPAIAFPPTLSSTNDTSPLPSPPLPQTTPPQLLITLDDGYVYEAFTIERAHVVFPRRSTDSTVPTVDRRRRVRRRSKTPTAADEDEQQPATTISTETANAHDEDEAPPLPSPTPSWGSSESLERSSVLASTLDRMLRRNREAPGSAESAAAQQEVEEAGVADHCGYFTATDTESELGSPAVGPSAVPAVTPADEKAHDEAFVAEANNRSPTDSLPPTTTSPSLNRESMSSFDLADLAHSTPLPLSPTSFHFISSSPPASSVSLTPSDSGVAHDDEHEPAEPAHGPVDDTATHSDEAADAPAAAAASPPSIQITLDDGFAYDAFTIERAHKVFPRRAAEPGSGVPTIDRRRRVRRRTEVGGGEQHQKKQAPMSVE